MKNSVKITNLTKSYGNAEIFKDFNLEINENTAFMAESGRGKTTLVRLILSLERPDSGKIEFENEPKFSAAFQEDRLFEDFSALENVSLVIKNHDSKAAKERAKELLSSMLISENDINRPVREFSGGMKRRVAICRALAADANITVLDEPYKGLDNETKRTCADAVKKYAEDKLLLLVTHDKTEAEITGVLRVVEV